jgi:4-amino-4-deoxy-L-arabinose transferase-like glycosyltransferase
MESKNRSTKSPSSEHFANPTNVAGYFRLGWLIILLIALSARFGAAVYWHRTAEQQTQGSATTAAAAPQPQSQHLPLRLGDSLSYWVLAQRLAHGQTYEYGSSDAQIFRAPLYPLFLVPFAKLSQWLGSEAAGIWWARVAGAVLGTWAIAIMMSLARQHFGICVALAAGSLAAVHPGSVGASVMILSEPLFMPLMVLSIAAGARALVTEQQSATASLACGALCGLGTLARPSWLLFLPFVVALGLLLSHDRMRWLRFGALAILGCCVVMSPWWVRNASITGRFVPSTLQVGLSLYDGWHPGATGASDEGMAFAFDIQAEQRALDAQATNPKLLESTFEYRVDSLAKRKALQWASQNPGEALRLAWIKFTRTWSLWPDGGELSSNRIRFAITVGTFSIVLLAIGATVLVLRKLTSQRRMITVLAFCWLPCIYFTLLHMVFVGSIRYREPAILVLSPLAGIALARFAGCFSQSPPLTEIQSVQGRASATDTAPRSEHSD